MFHESSLGQSLRLTPSLTGDHAQSSRDKKQTQNLWPNLVGPQPLWHTHLPETVPAPRSLDPQFSRLYVDPSCGCFWAHLTSLPSSLSQNRMKSPLKLVKSPFPVHSCSLLRRTCLLPVLWLLQAACTAITQTSLSSPHERTASIKSRLGSTARAASLNTQDLEVFLKNSPWLAPTQKATGFYLDICHSHWTVSTPSPHSKPRGPQLLPGQHQQALQSSCSMLAPLLLFSYRSLRDFLKCKSDNITPLLRTWQCPPYITFQ